MRTLVAQQLDSQKPWLSRLAYVLVRDKSAAEDLIQEAWAAALYSQPRFDQSLRPWLTRVLHNMVRSRVRHARSVDRWQYGAEPTQAPSPEEIFLRDESMRRLNEQVECLDEPYRSTVLLCYEDGLTPTEVAKRLGIPAGTVRWRLKHALDGIRSRIV